MAFLLLSVSCVRIDVPKLRFSQPQTYITKRECRVFHEEESFFPFCRVGGWWIEAIDYHNRFTSSKTLEYWGYDLHLSSLPVGTLMQECRSEIQYGFSLWYLFTCYESRRLKILEGELKDLVVISDNFWLPFENAYDAEILGKIPPKCIGCPNSSEE